MATQLPPIYYDYGQASDLRLNSSGVTDGGQRGASPPLANRATS